MHHGRLDSFAIVPLLASLTAAGCGQGGAALFPTSPTGSPGGAAFIEDGAVALDAQASSSATSTTLDRDDRGRGGGKPPSEQNQQEGNGDNERGTPEKGTKGELSGFVTAAPGTSLTVRGVTVTPAPGAVIRHGNRIVPFADIVVGDHVQARGTMGPAGLLATEIKVEQKGKDDDDEDDEAESESDETGTKIEGIVSNRAGDVCPNLSISVGTVPVTTTISTKFEDVSCTDLLDEMRVEVKGVLNAGVLEATKIEKD